MTLQSSPLASAVMDQSARLIRMKEVVELVGLARPTIYKLMSQPESTFPQPVKLTDSTARGAPVAWVLSEIQAWTLSRIQARDRVAA
ncbi:helix-turn-helix transcriptional regulator [Pseudomonas putida]|uniref:helix-turn-helix transcriptional regulator n=1 Tax=Pseudomonas putida TaxID=303 RepID=UPI002363DDBF|nr:AlpA family transcriptional regulator [Pseudomonas putida]MDD1990030.1 AlpA family transcriptional regulator [Pseudomonas putida]HDS1796685.1 AlpA family transcriptional regulator [Pseudomonas putida]